MLHMKIFNFIGIAKLKCLVRTLKDLNILASPPSKALLKYELYSFVVHNGESLNCGHYTSNTKIKSETPDGKIETVWKEFDFASVHSPKWTGPDPGACFDVYILFYRLIPETIG
jgi:ubiquitin C-terminal hydrolase